MDAGRVGADRGGARMTQLCIECRETYPLYAAHRCKPECTQCAKRCDRVLEVLGLPFCSRTCWRANERDAAPQPLTPGSKPL